MVTFRRLPYAVAFERGRLQRELLVDATRGRDTLDGLDRDWLDAEVARRLPTLPAEA
jgi:kynurenine 3-monooxygenase